MTDRAISINSKNFENFLQSKGFAPNSSGDELVYERAHTNCKHIYIRVYTSIAVNSTVSRGVGQDAIRVIAYFNNDAGKSFGIAGRKSLSRVYRTGSEEKIFERTLLRMREAYVIANEWLKKNPWAKT